MRDNGEPKIPYSTLEKAQKSAKRMIEKKGYHFSVYKCIFCNGFHIGARRYEMRQENK